METASTQLGTSPQHKVQTKFQIELPRELAESLYAWFKTSAGEAPSNLNAFANQVMQIPVVEYRRQTLPALPPAKGRISHGDKHTLTPEQQREIVTSFNDGKVSVAALASRFNVAKTTIRRVVDAAAAE